MRPREPLLRQPTPDPHRTECLHRMTALLASHSRTHPGNGRSATRRTGPCNRGAGPASSGLYSERIVEKPGIESSGGGLFDPR